MLTVFQVADYLLSHVNEDEGDLISNLKLQKLVYYAQGVNLALYDEPLFPEPICAWMHGPVVPTLYQHYKQHGDGPLPRPEIEDFAVYSQRDREVMDDVYNVFGQFAAWKLANMTHEERPWREKSAERGEMSIESIKEYFKDNIVTK